MLFRKKDPREKYKTDKHVFPFEEHVPAELVEVLNKYCKHEIKDKDHIFTITKDKTVIEYTISCDGKQATTHTRKIRASHIEHGGQIFRKHRAMGAYKHQAHSKHTETIVNKLIKLFTPDAIIHNEPSKQPTHEFSNL